MLTVVVGVLVALGVLLGTGPRPTGRLRRVVPISRRGPRTPVPRGELPAGSPGSRALPGSWVPFRRQARAVGAGPDVVGLAERVAALSRAGLPWPKVWQVLAEAPGPARPICAGVATQVAAGGSAAEGLRGAGGPASVQVRWLAVACDVTERAGAPVSDVLERFAGAVRADAAAAAEREAALAGARATAAVLSWLPLGGVTLGLLIGADPIVTLLGTGPGRICLVTGATLWMLGRWWTSVLIRRAERACTAERAEA